MEGWGDILKNYVDALSRAKNYRPTESLLEEDALPIGRESLSSKDLEEKSVYDFTNSEPIDLKYFIDGVQRTLLLGYFYSAHGIYPVHLHMSGAVMVDDQREIVFGPKTQTKIILPDKGMLPIQLDVVETRGLGKPTNDYLEFRRRAHRLSTNLRRDIEQDVLRYKPDRGYVGVDGPIPVREEFLERTNLVGVIKNHYAQYLSPDDELRAFNLASGYRSWLFEIEHEWAHKTYPLNSCYLKLYDFEPSPIFGLLRIEFNPNLKEYTDNISYSIFAERLPVEMKMRNWDRMLYPFHVCEKVIYSQFPSIESIRAIFGLR